LNEKTVASKRKDRVQALKKLFECKDAEKVIHDSRMDCDALYNLHGISVVNVHDTSCFHACVTGVEDASLNDVLSHNGIQENASRDKSVYRSNPAFWATRPLTNAMIDWSSSDVNKLLAVATRQTEQLKIRGSYDAALNESGLYTMKVSSMKLESGLVCKVHIGGFIGTRGRNLRSLQRRTGTLIYQEHTPGVHANTWMVYYTTSESLAAVKRAMGHY